VVTLDVTRKEYDYFQPWSRRAQSAAKVGVVTGARQILTTGRDLQDLTLVRVQKGGRGRWWDAEVEWVDYLANVALITVRDEAFWTDSSRWLAERIPARPTATICVGAVGRWTCARRNSAGLGDQPGVYGCGACVFGIERGTGRAGWGEPVRLVSEVIGLVFSQMGSVSQVLPAPFIRSILEARQEGGGYRGLGYFDFTWQPTENPETHRFLGLPGEPRGVVVIEVPEKPGVPLRCFGRGI
jgi:hypothetical protein